MNYKNPELAEAFADTAELQGKDHSRYPNCEEDGAVLCNEVHEFLGRFVAYPSEHAKCAHALWDIPCPWHGGMGVNAETGIPLARAGKWQDPGA
jgi:hypothetical protein